MQALPLCYLGTVLPTCNPDTGEAEARGSGDEAILNYTALRLPELHNTLS